MIDFLMISKRTNKRGTIEIYPKFIVKKSSDLMIRGGDFYAIWIEDQGLWSTDEQDVLQLIDSELDKYAEENSKNFDCHVKVLHMWDSETGMIDFWHRYCQRQMRDSFRMLDEKLIFSNTATGKKDYASKRLNYPLQKGDLTAYNRLISTLYSEEEQRKIEWAIGSIVSGESKRLQKFMVLYGSAGSGKSTILNIIQMLFEGYTSVFDAKALGSSSNSFALEAFKGNPLVAIQHDGDLSKIEDNTRLNSLVSHELMTVNEKFKSAYASQFKCFLFMGTNKPVKITDAKSGLIRRLIDVSPSGNKIALNEYKTATNQVLFELGAIAYHCQEIYLSDPDLYDNYIPVRMLGASNDFYNFIIDSYHIFKKEDGTSLKIAWEMYKAYCDDAKVPYALSQRSFKEELKNYFHDYKERFNLNDGSRVRSYYYGFRTDKFEQSFNADKPKEINSNLIQFNSINSLFDIEYANCKAQYANEKEKPTKKWDEVITTLSHINTCETHYVVVPENHVVIDFDIPDESGKKSFEKNLEAASKWPPTYAELSKSGCGVHLHYIYDGDVSKLSRIYDDHIEVKIAIGNSSLRRKLTKCNDIPIATINSGLPLKGESKMINFDAVKSEKSLRTLIKRNLDKEVHPGTKPSIDFIYKILEEASKSGLSYDVSDMKNAVLAFAASSSHQSDYCIKLVAKMPFKSEVQSEAKNNDNEKLVFYDVEIFPNLFLINWKMEGEEKPVIRMINPSPSEVEEIMRYRLVGFNCRRYDNHMLYARMMGYTNEQLYNLSQRIIKGVSGCFFGEAYTISYTDVYDFSSKKQSLKQFEIELGIRHKELGLPWDQPVPEEKWVEVAEYCDNDVIATEATFNSRKADFIARQVLADVAGMTVNDTTNSLTTRIIFGNNRKPQSSFNYRFMGVDELPFTMDGEEYILFDKQGRPEFPGYTFENGKSTYRGEEVGEGGYVYAEPGIYGNVAVLDIASMHPSTAVAENFFGDEYTARFKEILDARIAIKHKDFDKARTMLNGSLNKYLTDGSSAKDLAYALKIAINSVYGLTSANFDNPFKDPRNVDNIVAKRGALFMINLKHEVQKRGFIVAHIKTDSIKIPDATTEIIQFVSDFGKKYGYTFEHESTYERICLVNDAVYIAKYATKEQCEFLYKYIPGDNFDHGSQWTATGTQFQVPYVFKTLFSREPIEFEDMCKTMAVTSALYLDMNESLPDVSTQEKEFECLEKIQNKTNLKEEDIDHLKQCISEGHSYKFIGKVGRFCPIKPGCGGGTLLREKDGKYYAAAGSKGYHWMESEMVKVLEKESDIDRSYYNDLVDEALKRISSYGDSTWFISDDERYHGPKIINGEPLYFDEPPIY